MLGYTPLLWTEFLTLVTSRNEVLAKVMFLQASVILSTGGGSGPGGFLQISGGEGSGPRGSSKFSGGVSGPGGFLQILGGVSPIFRGGSGPGGVPPNFLGGGLHQNTVNVRLVCILLECILVKT